MAEDPAISVVCERPIICVACEKPIEPRGYDDATGHLVCTKCVDVVAMHFSCVVALGRVKTKIGMTHIGETTACPKCRTCLVTTPSKQSQIFVPLSRSVCEDGKSDNGAIRSLMDMSIEARTVLYDMDVMYLSTCLVAYAAYQVILASVFAIVELSAGHPNGFFALFGYVFVIGFIPTFICEFLRCIKFVRWCRKDTVDGSPPQMLKPEPKRGVVIAAILFIYAMLIILIPACSGSVVLSLVLFAVLCWETRVLSTRIGEAWKIKKDGNLSGVVRSLAIWYACSGILLSEETTFNVAHPEIDEVKSGVADIELSRRVILEQRHISEVRNLYSKIESTVDAARRYVLVRHRLSK